MEAGPTVLTGEAVQAKSLHLTQSPPQPEAAQPAQGPEVCEVLALAILFAGQACVSGSRNL